ncbi:PAAR domain-containing protein [Massilia antarctica]|uniref:PAAR domain-containing protein n=1 Tax=Massilia antarctica TaxID=2765360 RepID=A0AA48WBR2_9BURK|nr:PAAR domain-containing protein [Massilia antarctica]QPI48778.1 PAAR domain-containing protein [Massilia antarctica]
MPQAARLGDPIGHSPTMSWLVTGALVAGAIAGTAIAIVGTGGLAAVAIMGGALAGGAGIGEALSTMSFAPKEVCGTIVGVCSSNVFTNGRPAARAHVDMTFCAKHPQVPLPIATGSASVFINGLPAARVDDTIACSAVITDGSGNVFIGGATVKTDVISPEELVPPAVHTAMLVVGVASAVILAGPVVAVVGLGLGMGGGMLGGFVGGKVFGEGTDGQKWSALGGSVIGGMLGGKIGTGIVNKAIPSPITPGMGFIKGGLPGMRAAQSVFDMRTPEAEAIAIEVANVMDEVQFGKGSSKALQVLTHEDGTVSVGVSGNLKAGDLTGKITRLQKTLDDKYGEGIYKVGKTTLDENHNVTQARNEAGDLISNSPGMCAEPKAAAVAADNPSPITGSATIWRGKGPNPHPYTNKTGKIVTDRQMDPCPTCSVQANRQIYHSTAISAANVEGSK